MTDVIYLNPFELEQKRNKTKKLKVQEQKRKRSNNSDNKTKKLKVQEQKVSETAFRTQIKLIKQQINFGLQQLSGINTTIKYKKPEYIEYIQLGNDILYNGIYNSKQEFILDLFMEDFNDETYEKSSSLLNTDNREDILFKNSFKYFLELIQTRDVIKGRQSQSKGGNKLLFTPKQDIINYLENQYIFDSNHDFKKFLNKGFNNVLYSIADIKKANMKKYFNYADRDIFIDIIKTNKELFDNIYYFSIYNFIKQKSISDIVGQQIIKDDNDITKIINNIIDFYNDILQTRDFKLILDVKMNVGNIGKLKDFGEKLQKENLLDNITSLIKQQNNYEKVKRDFHYYIEKNTVITLEDTFDSASLSRDKAHTFLNEKIKKTNIELFAYISHLIFSDCNFADLGNLNENKQLLKAFNEENQKLFNVVYYLNSTNHIKTAFLFKKTHLFKSITDKSILEQINRSLIHLIKPKSANNYIYNEILNTNKQSFYAIDLFKLSKFNSNPHITANITKKIFPRTSITQYYSDLLNPESILLLYIALYISEQPDNDLSKIENKIKMSRLLLDLKKAGDASKVLFTYFYNYIRDNKVELIKTVTNLPANLDNVFVADAYRVSPNVYVLMFVPPWVVNTGFTFKTCAT